MKNSPTPTSIPLTPTLAAAIKQSLLKAAAFRGATAPNPPVGAAALSREGAILGVTAHERAGTPHAEAKLLLQAEQEGWLSQIDTLFVTLEPCCHSGRTGPCTEAIIHSGVKKIIFGVEDPNPRVAGKGAEILRTAQCEVTSLSHPDCDTLIAPFRKWILTGLPWVTVKTVHQISRAHPACSSLVTFADFQETMIPPEGQSTFSNPESLKLAHELRRRSDAIITGSGTVLSDRPEFTVRHVPDHVEKSRVLLVLDSRHRIQHEASDWVHSREAAGFEVHISSDSFQNALTFLGKKGCLEVLVEAGPGLSFEVLRINPLFDEHIEIWSDGTTLTSDQVRRNVNLL